VSPEWAKDRRAMHKINEALSEMGVRPAPQEIFRSGGRVRRISVKVDGESKAERRLRRMAERKRPRIRDLVELNDL